MNRSSSTAGEGSTVFPDQVSLGGFLNIDKPAGWTSHDVVAKIRRLLGFKRVGHLGTLDPEATGVLPICFGYGTKLASLLNDADKTYEAVLRLGEETETEDATGRVTRVFPLPASLQGENGERTIADTLAAFVGRYLQQPPMYSAVKVNGVPLYKAARRGEVVARPSRTVAIHAITFLGRHGRDVAFRVACSKGTYIRTLCADVGTKLGVGGHLLSLRRVQAGPFLLRDALELDTLAEQCASKAWSGSVYPFNRVLSGLPALSVRPEVVAKVLNGVQIGLDGLARWLPFQKGDSLRLLDPGGRLLAIGVALRDSDSAGEGSPYRIKTVLSGGGNRKEGRWSPQTVIHHA